MVGGMCSMLPCGTGICSYACIKKIIASVHSFLILFFFFNLVLINRRNGPRYQRVLALCAFFLIGAIPKGLILRKFCVWRLYKLFLCKFVSGLILWFLRNLWFNDLRAE